MMAIAEYCKVCATNLVTGLYRRNFHQIVKKKYSLNAVPISAFGCDHKLFKYIVLQSFSVCIQEKLMATTYAIIKTRLILLQSANQD